MSDIDAKKLTERYDFALDKFQLDAIASINDGLNVLVAAPTGSGKTVVAEYAVARAHRAGLRSHCSLPVKHSSACCWASVPGLRSSPHREQAI
jgi:ATP-dependent RNA helicase HelY